MLLNEPNENYKTGYIKLFRSLKNHWLWDKGRKRTKFEAWLDLLLMASHSGTKEPIGYDLIEIKTGQILTSQEKLSIQWRWDRGAVRSFLKLLEKDGMLNQQTTSKYTMITICKYDSYQKTEPSKSLKPTNGTTSSQQQVPTYNNVNNDKNVKEEILRGKQNSFNESLLPFIVTYSKDMIDEFSKYWTEPNKTKSKMRYEKEEFFDIPRRLATWAKNYKGKIGNEPKRMVI